MSHYAFLLALSVLITACSHAPKQPLAMSQSLPPIAAEFETTIEEGHGNNEQQPHRWRFWRSHNRVETLSLEDRSGETWQQIQNGELEYQRIFHAHQQIIDYVPGDLKAIGAQADWTSLSSLLSPEQRNSLQDGTPENLLEKSALHYQSTIDAMPFEVIWLEREQLPGLIRRQENGHTLVTRIIAVYPLTQAPWSAPATDDYHHTDFSDLGDKENDPFIHSILPKLKGHQHHEH